MTHSRTFGIPGSMSMIAVFKMLDTTSTSTGPGYDSILTEPNLEGSGADDKIGRVGREETSDIKVRCQFDENPTDNLRQQRHGKDRGQSMEVIVDLRELEIAGQIDDDGEPRIRTGARLDRIELRDESVYRRFPENPGMYVTKIERDTNFGRTRQLVFVCEPRKRGT